MITSLLERLSRTDLDLHWYAGRRILVTGGAGFIGSWLVEALARLGSDVYIVDNLWRGSLANLKRADGTSWIRLADHFTLADLREYSAALTACLKAKPDLVFHLADVVAGVDFVFANEPFIFRTNLLINSNILAAAVECGVPRLTYLGTACSYPKSLQATSGGAPLVEQQAYPADPESAYGWSKLMGEYEAELVGNHSAMQVGILRAHNIYGPRTLLSVTRSQVIPSLIRKAIRYPEEEFVVWGSGKQARDFLFVADAVDALLRLPLRGMPKGPIQIGTAVETTVAQLASLIVELSGKDIPIRFDTQKPEGDRARSGSYEKAKEELGWDVTTALRDGLAITYEWASEQIHNGKVNLDA
jgi:nucleoside-diphosphate-sugar epimerase